MPRPRVKQQAARPRRTTLRALLMGRARKDRRFFQALLDDPNRALQAAGVTLSPRERQVLRRSLRKGRVHVQADLSWKELRHLWPWWRGLSWPWRP